MAEETGKEYTMKGWKKRSITGETWRKVVFSFAQHGPPSYGTPPTDSGLQVICFFLTEERSKGKKVLFSWKSRFTDCPRKITPASARRGKREASAQRYTITAYIYICIYIYEEILYRKGAENPCQDPWGWIRVCVCVCDGKHYSRLVCPWSCVALCSCRQLLCITGSGWASVLNTQSSSGRRSSSENSRYRYLWSHTDGVNKTSPSKHCINTNMPVCFCMLPSSQKEV